jgi:S1-C subfamily serine protease
VTADVADKYNLAAKRGVVVESSRRTRALTTQGPEGRQDQVVVAGETFVLGGDVIVSFGGKRISSIEQLRDAVAAHKPGDKVKVVIYRDASKTSVTVTLGRSPHPPRASREHGPGLPGPAHLHRNGVRPLPGPRRLFRRREAPSGLLVA